jgi:hypothetical protein
MISKEQYLGTGYGTTHVIVGYLSLKFLHPGLGSFKGVCIGYVINYDGGLSSSETNNKG